MPLEEARTNATGLYGHVTQDAVDGHPGWKIEYWQFFATNDQDIRASVGDISISDIGVDGDWTSVQLWYDRTLRRVARVKYLIHGFPIVFHLPDEPLACRDCTLRVNGARFDPNVGAFFDEKERPKYDDNQADFFVDASGFRHPMVYIERGGHEFWPGPWGAPDIQVGPAVVHLSPHNGLGTGYLVPDARDRPFNVGEVGRPLSAAARAIISFNGQWGCTNTKEPAAPMRRSPVGPAAHCSWKWPGGSAVHDCEE